MSPGNRQILEKLKAVEENQHRLEEILNIHTVKIAIVETKLEKR